MKKILACLLILALPLPLLWIASAQGPIQVGSMIFDYEIQNDSVQIELKAPTRGWVGIGFNDKNAIIGSDLLLFSVRNGKTISADQYVRGPQDHPDDNVLGGRCDIQVLSGQEVNGWTTVQFKIPLNSGDQFDFEHDFEKETWLIMAYSREDDFTHHSMMRKHLKFKW